MRAFLLLALLGFGSFSYANQATCAGTVIEVDGQQSELKWAAVKVDGGYEFGGGPVSGDYQCSDIGLTDEIVSGALFVYTVLVTNGTITNASSVSLYPEQCRYDIFPSGNVDNMDLIMFKNEYAKDCALGTCVADFNNDGFINVEDLILFKRNFGSSCPI